MINEGGTTVISITFDYKQIVYILREIQSELHVMGESKHFSDVVMSIDSV